MEGICGIFSFDNKIAAIGQKIDRMANHLSDGEELKIFKLSGKNWALAYSNWCEPYWTPLSFQFRNDRITVVCVADIFNTPELFKKYGIIDNNLGHFFAVAYLKDGTAFLPQIKGNFAFILIDHQNNKVLSGTDKIGIRPLYWYRYKNNYYFGSRLCVIRTVCDGLAIDNNAIYAYIQYSMIPSPMTIYKDAFKLEPGFYLTADRNGSKVNRYWDITNEPKLIESQHKITERVYQTIEDAVLATASNGCESRQNIACFLSGGTDSSALCGLLQKSFAEPVHAYSMGFDADGYDEMYYARIAARAFGLKHHEYYMQPQDVSDSLESIISAFDEPYDNSSVFPALRCAQMAVENGAHYILAGDGGDEIFAGNERYGIQKLFNSYFLIPAFLRKYMLEPLILERLDKLPVHSLQKAGNYIRRAKISEVQRISSYKYFTDQELFTPDFLSACDIDAVKHIPERHYDNLLNAQALDRHLYMDMKLTITDNDLRKVNRMCDLGHIRVRYPLLDAAVVEEGFAIPENLKLKGLNGLRYIFKQAFKELLPNEILKKQKHGFGLPIAAWLQTDPKIKTLGRDLISSSNSLHRGLFKKDFIEKLWDLQQSDDTPYYGTLYWQLVVLEAWQRHHVEGKSLKI